MVHVPDYLVLQLMDEVGRVVYSLDWDGGAPGCNGFITVWAYGDDDDHFIYMEGGDVEWIDSSLEDLLESEKWPLWTVSRATKSIWVDLPDQVVMERVTPLEEDGDDEWITEVNGRPIRFPSKTPVEQTE